MRVALFMLLVSLVLATSGCVRETGDLPIKLSELSISPGANDSIGPEAMLSEEPESNLSEEPETSISDEQDIATEEPANETSPQEPCANITCDESITTCPDGETLTCENECEADTGNCTSCIPDCSGHEEAPCTLGCGLCETPDEDACECITKLYCEPNGICEPKYNSTYEWLFGEDCAAFGQCDDGDNCTQDTFDPNRQECKHTDICCDDGDPCTEGSYNFDSGLCEFKYICCGDGQCQADRETEESCPEDCTPTEKPQIVNRTHINETEEIVTLSGDGVDMTNWTIEDARPDISGHVYTFPENFTIQGIAYLHRGTSASNSTDLFWGNEMYIWNNNHDNATLRNSTGEVVSFYEY